MSELEATKLRIESERLKRRADALAYTPMEDKEWDIFEATMLDATSVAPIAEAWNNAFCEMWKRFQTMRQEALYWREQYNTLAALSKGDSK